MYEHPYLAYKVTEFDQEQLQRAVDRRRFLAEHADQIVPRAAGPMRRMWSRMLRGSAVPRTDAERTDAERTDAGWADAVRGGRPGACAHASAR